MDTIIQHEPFEVDKRQGCPLLVVSEHATTQPSPVASVDAAVQALHGQNIMAGLVVELVGIGALLESLAEELSCPSEAWQ